MSETKVFRVTDAGFEEGKPFTPSGEFHEHWASLPGAKFTEALASALGVENLGSLWGDEDAPDVTGDVGEALLALGKPTRLWWNPRVLCLVIDDGTRKVGVKSSSMRVPLLGFVWPRLEELYQGLKSKMRPN
jgi:hypothetical protein